MKKELLPLIKDKLKVKKHRLASLLGKRDEIAAQQKQYRVDNKIEFFDGTDRFYKGTERDGDLFGPNPVQAKLLEAWENVLYKTFTMTGANRVGKTAILTIIAVAYMIGFWPWNGKRIPINHKKPRKIRYIGQDWEKHIKGVVVPCLEEWWPKRRKLTTKNNQVGAKTFWKDVESGSTLEIMSSQQDSSQHEGWEGDLIPFDEPPPRDIYIANARGLIDREGREIFGATLLKEAWVDREIIKKRDKDGKPDMSVFNVHGDAYENVGYGVTLEGVEQFKNKLNEDEIQARIYGKPSYMSGLVYPTFNRQTHLKKRFKVPLNWIVDVAIDVHPRKKQAISFIATSPKQEKYLIHEIWEHGDGQWIGEEVVRMMNRHSYRAGRFLIDPLAKGDGNNENTVFDKVSDALFRHGFILETGSKDKSSGIIAVKTHLMGANNEPSLYIFDDLSRVVYEIEGYMYDDKGEPKKIDDDMLENLRRLLLLDTMYTEMEDEEEFVEAGIGRDGTGGY